MATGWGFVSRHVHFRNRTVMIDREEEEYTALRLSALFRTWTLHQGCLATIPIMNIRLGLWGPSQHLLLKRARRTVGGANTTQNLQITFELQMEKRRIPAFQAHNRDLEESSALGSLDSLTGQARASRVGNDAVYITDRPGLPRQQLQHESRMSIPPSQPSQQLSDSERSQGRNTVPWDAAVWQNPRDPQTLPLIAHSPNSITTLGQISTGKTSP
ncbi:hypothetical protein N431DRAFT_451523 [Stipitochalara longipes BDJ]|nr:hypothetical protein N431DRAFT_451523 [Stipitochalara longipes BDJ]